MEMRDVLADLGAEFQEHIRETQREQARELAGSETLQITFAARLLGAVGKEITLILCDKTTVCATVSEVGPDWVVLETLRWQDLVFFTAVAAVRGLPAQPAWASEVEKRMTPTMVLRRWWDEQCWVQVAAPAGTFSGYVQRVGKDFIDLRVQENRELNLAMGAGAGDNERVICLPLSKIWRLRAENSDVSAF